ncbi:MAG: hypothetical protein M1812_002907 [Candelaria pacifica]|nr:MAG: hypothetical protein M1812_002907 [Candelaria pacifica]
MRITGSFGLLAFACFTNASNLRPRNYDSHDYYALHLESSTSPQQLANSLGLEHEGQLGELPGHHLFSCSKRPGDVVGQAQEDLRRRRRKRASRAGRDLLDGVLFSQKQKLKPRLEKRGVIPIIDGRAGPPVESEAGPPAVAPPAPAPGVTPGHSDDDPLPDSDGGTSPGVTTPELDAAIIKQLEIAKSLDIQDPIFKDQWHLYNPVQLGHDVNVTGVWAQGITGQNSTVAIIDDGLDMYSDDLRANYFAEGSWDFNDPGPEPKPRLSDDKHGTRCAGEIGAVKNNVCGVGVAWDARVAGIRILSKQISDADEAIAMNYAFQKNQIYSCSWGPPDDGQSMDAPGILIKRAMVNGVQNGRDGKGSVYVFAAGNGAGSGDNCNFDGYTNSIYSITIGAIDRKGMHPYYSEKCSAQLVVTYSSGSGDAIHTTDVGTNKCYSQHGGTSAAAPLAAGIFSLVLSIRPDLTWRDLQYLALDTAVPVHEDDDEWQTTTIGKKFSHKFGYGKLDVYAIVEAAKEFKSVKPQAWYNSPWIHVKHTIPQGDQGLASIYEVTDEQLQKANFERMEHVTVTMNVEHARRGDLSVELKSPNGIISHLSATRKNDASSQGYQDWTFMSVIHWGESGIGQWTVIVKDTEVNEHNGTFVDWKITLWGECKDASKQDPLPMPTEHDDDDHDAIPTGIVATTSVAVAASATDTPITTPTDHPDRPVNAKPTGTTEEEEEEGATPTSTGESTASPTASSVSDHFLPSFFPTFGVSKRTQVWIYGALGLIAVFCASLGTYFFLARRRRLRNNPREGYEFEPLDHEGLMNGNGAAGGRKGKKRAGELYDAFAGESDEDLFSDGEDAEEYKDVNEYEDEEVEQEGERSSGGERGNSEKPLSK